MKVAVEGRGAVKDTYNLLADGIVQVVRALAQLDGTRAEVGLDDTAWSTLAPV